MAGPHKPRLASDSQSPEAPASGPLPASSQQHGAPAVRRDWGSVQRALPPGTWAVARKAAAPCPIMPRSFVLHREGFPPPVYSGETETWWTMSRPRLIGGRRQWHQTAQLWHLLRRVAGERGVLWKPQIWPGAREGPRCQCL